MQRWNGALSGGKELKSVVRPTGVDSGRLDSEIIVIASNLYLNRPSCRTVL